MNITEPMSLLTDYLLAVLTGTLSFSLLRMSKMSAKLWAGAFIAIGSAALVGGTFHGAGHILSERTLSILWKITIFIAGFVSFFMLMAAVVDCLPKPWRPWVLCLAIIKLGLYLFWMFSHDEFRFVIYDYGPVMVVILCLYGTAFFRFKQKSALMIVGGLLLSIIAALLQASGWDISPNFNHNDLYHVIQMGATFLTYKGVKQGAINEGIS